MLNTCLWKAGTVEGKRGHLNKSLIGNSVLVPFRNRSPHFPLSCSFLSFPASPHLTHSYTFHSDPFSRAGPPGLSQEATLARFLSACCFTLSSPAPGLPESSNSLCFLWVTDFLNFFHFSPANAYILSFPFLFDIQQLSNGLWSPPRAWF